MFYIILAMLIVVPSPSLGLVDCLVACSRCQRRQERYPGVLEVYCAMCRECSDRRRELRLREGPDVEPIYNLDNDPDECPTPPPCESDPEDPPPYTLSHTIRHKLTTTTTTRRTCPPVTGCQIRVTTAPPPPPPSPAKPRCYYPCLPACPCPYPYPYPSMYPTAVPQNLVEATTVRSDKSTGYMYVYVGVPKDVLRKKIQ